MFSTEEPSKPLKKKDQPRAVDLFSGAGGLTCGLKRAGFSVVAAVDNDGVAAESYRMNHPEVNLIQRDIHDVRVAELKRSLNLKRGALELLAGCPPCQAFSNLRSRNGKYRVRDNAKDLIFQFMKFVRGLLPKAVMLENVPGLKKDRRIRQAKQELEDLGYDVICDVLNAANYGVPQRRRRMILIAIRRADAAFGPEARCERLVEDAIRGLSKRERRDFLHDTRQNRSERIRKLIGLIPKNGGSRRSLGKRGQLQCHKKCDGFKDIYGRMAWDDFAPTLTSGCINPSKGRFLHPSCNRPITLREAALLQSFPKRYRFSLRYGKYAVARLIGNALPPEFIRRHALQIIKSLSGVPRGRGGSNGNRRKRRTTQ